MEPTSSDTMTIRSLDEGFGQTRSTVLFHSDRVKVIRLALTAQETIKEHQAPGPLVVHCLKGNVEFSVQGKHLKLRSGDLIHLAKKELHSVHAFDEAILLLTIVSLS